MDSLKNYLFFLFILSMTVSTLAQRVPSFPFRNYRGYDLPDDYVHEFNGERCNATEGICYWPIHAGRTSRFRYNMTFEARSVTDSIQSVLIVSDQNNTYMDFRFVCRPSPQSDQICPTEKGRSYFVEGDFQLNSSSIQPLDWNKVVDVMHYYYDNLSYPMAFFRYKAYLYDETACESSAMDQLLNQIENAITEGYRTLDQLRNDDNILAEGFSSKLASLSALSNKLEELNRQQGDDLFKFCFEAKKIFNDYQNHYLPKINLLRYQVLNKNYDPVLRMMNDTINRLKDKFGDFTVEPNLNQPQNFDLFLQNFQTQLQLFKSLDPNSKEAEMLIGLMLNSIELAENIDPSLSQDNQPHFHHFSLRLSRLISRHEKLSPLAQS